MGWISTTQCARLVEEVTLNARAGFVRLWQVLRARSSLHRWEGCSTPIPDSRRASKQGLGVLASALIVTATSSNVSRASWT